MFGTSKSNYIVIATFHPCRISKSSLKNGVTLRKGSIVKFFYFLKSVLLTFLIRGLTICAKNFYTSPLYEYINVDCYYKINH